MDCGNFALIDDGSITSTLNEPDQKLNHDDAKTVFPAWILEFRKRKPRKYPKEELNKGLI
jgi:hypothetical protein